MQVTSTIHITNSHYVVAYKAFTLFYSETVPEYSRDFSYLHTEDFALGADKEANKRRKQKVTRLLAVLHFAAVNFSDA